jgi:hypothetical protein
MTASNPGLAGSAGHERRLAIIVPALILASGLVNYVLYHDISLLRLEALLACGVVIGIGVLLGLILSWLPSDRLRATLLCVMILVFLDLQYQAIGILLRLVSVDEYRMLRYLGLFAGLAVSYVLLISLSKHLSTILSAVFAILLVSSIAIPPEPVRLVFETGQPSAAEQSAPRADLPPVLHLVLDGHIGIGGIPIDIEGGHELQQRIEAFYLKHGFRLFGRTYSEYMLTPPAMTTILNGAQSVQLVETSGTENTRWALPKNAYFSSYMDKGYNFRIYETEYVRYCGSTERRPEYCYTYSTSGLRLMDGLGLSTVEKAEFIVGSYFSRSRFYFVLFQGYDRVRTFLKAQGIADLPRGNRRSYTLHSLGTLAALRQLKKDIVAGSAEGRLFFAHLMLPHQPYFLTSDCRVREFDDWYNCKLYHDDLERPSSSQFREEAYQRYFEQTTCLLGILDDLFGAMRDRGIFDRATVIVHGDHGSRITIHDPVFENVDRLSPRDLIDAYSVLFAVRIPGAAGGYDTRMRSVQDLFGEYLLGLPPKEVRNRVYLAPTERFGVRPYDMAPIVASPVKQEPAP